MQAHDTHRQETEPQTADGAIADRTEDLPEQPTTTVPAGEEPVARCRFCHRPFPSDHLHALHLGTYHEAELTDEEVAVVEAARDEETDDLFLFHLQVIAALAILYTVIVLVYMVVLSL
ncbi:DUF7410 domain-containing protein [Haloarchaeobius sp. TZWWS8]|uniref:DUF7410 domain-containing protein n=1 Tax=Haloarchaeobius sp. TZWWS8 TaxID=3446121 RepID=UPI003EBA5300